VVAADGLTASPRLVLILGSSNLIFKTQPPDRTLFMLKHTSAKDLPAHLRLSEDQTTELADMFRLMSDPSRLRIILSCLETPVSVGDMANQLGLSASLVSHHLRLLRAGRLIQAERRGNRVFYLITDEHIRRVLSDMVDHVAESVPDMET
jgi:DNA-binding transcriptional ArsR family regulator